MANEADVRRGLTRDVEYWTVADATAIPKGTLMVTTNANRVAIAHSGGMPCCPIGYTIEEKEALDGKTEIGIQISGLCEAYVTTAAVVAGDLLIPDTTANRLIAAVGSAAGAISGQFLRAIIGMAMDSQAAAGYMTVKLGRVVK